MAAPSAHRLSVPQTLRQGRSAPVATDSPNVVASPPLLYGVTFLAGVLLHGVFPKPITAPNVAIGSGLALLFVGTVAATWSRRAMEAAGTNANPALPATTLIVSGPFGFSRNPMYVARTILYLGLGLLMNALCVLAVLVPLLFVMQYGVIRREERYLEGKFGDAYRQYQAAVRRWL
ncbi:MAG TPA: isoprenylcysteine carboxylmethyltransferase family protein [Candidatus Margulisiibacteriota bacterium]|nr:isoprenylcysteine carboxylmethyltransferase family protein [Candidatus Margulisiibacteriota bacterium]